MTELEPHFTFLYDQLKDVYTGYSNYIFTTTASILLIIGWLLTSTDARTYLSEHPGMRIPMTVAIILILLAEIWISIGTYHTSRELLGLIREALIKHPDPLITDGYYMPKVVPVKGIIVFVTAHAVLYTVFCLIMWSIPNTL